MYLITNLNITKYAQTQKRSLSQRSKDNQASFLFELTCVVSWIGALVIHVNARLLGHKASLMHVISFLGYSVFPMSVVAFLGMFMPFAFINLLLILCAMIWSVSGTMCVCSILIFDFNTQHFTLNTNSIGKVLFGPGIGGQTIVDQFSIIVVLFHTSPAVYHFVNFMCIGACTLNKLIRFAI